MSRQKRGDRRGRGTTEDGRPAFAWLWRICARFAIADRRNIGRRLDALQNGWAGDVKKLSARTHEYRLRVGNLRVLFTLEKDLIGVYAVRDRKAAYE
jgi:mRNA interferase RelE/StbE